MSEYATAVDGTLQPLAGMAKPRVVFPLKIGPPNGPFALRVSAIRQGVTGTKLRAEMGLLELLNSGTQIRVAGKSNN